MRANYKRGAKLPGYASGEAQFGFEVSKRTSLEECLVSGEGVVSKVMELVLS